MLNISKNSISSDFNDKKYKSLNIVKMQRRNGLLYKLSLGGLASLILIGFLPWTQNISSSGQVTALSPEQRPQTIHSIIPGRIESWMVQEGQLVNRGDTIALLSEIKEDYFDPNLIKNVESQIKAKELGVKSYMDKVNALDNQIDALIKNQVLKKEQARNKILQAQLKIVSDSIDFEAMKTDLKIAEDQVERMETLYAEGLKSLTDVEAKRLKYQESLAKKTSQENKLLTSRNELINSKVELNNIDNEFADKIAKSESD
ncbi:MAG: adhesin transport system membrane fusion protein, partial [Chitinophagales bacterium]